MGSRAVLTNPPEDTYPTVANGGSVTGSKIQVILPPLAVATANKGDRASIDITIAPMR